MIDKETEREWRGYPYPDTKSNDKYKLEVAAIEALSKTVAPGMTVHIWQGYCCVDQNSNLGQAIIGLLDKIVQICNCILTPNVDHDSYLWCASWLSTDISISYSAARFDGGPSRVYQSLVVSHGNAVRSQYPAAFKRAEEKVQKFHGGLQVAHQLGNRPHFVCGSKEMFFRNCPIQLLPLAYSHLESFSPMDCVENLIEKEDEETIHQLMEQLQPHIKKANPGYDGNN